MKINVSKVPEGGMSLKFERDGVWFRENLSGTATGDFELERIASDDPTALVGLPLIAVARLLRAEGVDVLRDAATCVR